MTTKEFNKLSKRDFENGAVIDDIYVTLIRYENLQESYFKLSHIADKFSYYALGKSPVEYGGYQEDYWKAGLKEATTTAKEATP